jgi:hypothetical protein
MRNLQSKFRRTVIGILTNASKQSRHGELRKLCFDAHSRILTYSLSFPRQFFVFPKCLAFQFFGQHIRNNRRKLYRARRFCRKEVPINFPACSLRSSRKKIKSAPLRAFDNSAFRNAVSRLHRLRSCSPSQKGNTMSDSKKPIAKVSLHPVSAAIWRNQNQKGEVFFSVTVERSYKDDAGNWQSSTSFSAGDLLLLSKVTDLAHTEIFKLRANERNAQAEDQAA